uniref:Uncharacterized protein n=2 Tax=unclassified Caudoviricetes TaxID=2788787 RepID=A0A8S5NMQ1_9CAUD|nr:MAG TPA: hypothetical protein [Myoviridae sp. ctSGm32]DAD98999.1 MAG TPA: hypothetical protein [Myoviridae sp. ctjs85]
MLFPGLSDLKYPLPTLYLYHFPCIGNTQKFF